MNSSHKRYLKTTQLNTLNQVKRKNSVNALPKKTTETG